MNYIPLEVKTSYSFLESMNTVESIIDKAKELNVNAIAITDNNMFAVPSFYEKCKQNNIKPIIGLTVYTNNGYILLYAINNNGYSNLCKLTTELEENPFNINILSKYKDDLLLIIPYKYFNEEIYNIFKYKYIGYSNLEEKNKIKEDKVLITSVSYINKEDHKYLDYLYMIKELKKIGEYELGTHKKHHFLSLEEVNILSEDKDINNTNIIASMCNVTLDLKEGLLPIYDKEKNAYEYLTYLCNKGLNKRLDNNIPSIYKERLEYELNIINKMKFCDYFLVVWDYVKYAKQNNILVGPGRGSAAGSLVSYTLGITDIDPIKYNLLFERFLNPERVTMPDIDMDFDSTRREDVINYVKDKYGKKNVSGIITFDTLSSKQVIRDVARVMDFALSEIDILSNQLTSKENLQTNINNNTRLKRMIEASPRYERLFDIAMHLEGLPRNTGIHASGIIICPHNIDEYVPLYKSSKGLYLAGYKMEYLEKMGLLKMDFLAVSNLTLINNIINNIRTYENINIKMSNIPLDNKQVFDIFKTANTNDIFQFESTGMKNFLLKLKPNNFLELVDAIALYRPGAMDYIDTYINRRNGQEEVDYIIDDLEPILKDTYGIIIYQEQIMEIAKKLAGYSLGEADILRRAISKKKENILLEEQEKFIKRSINNGYKYNDALNVYNQILKFAGYGFNKSHSVAYAITSYKMAFLKRHFFKYFAIEILNASIGSNETTLNYIREIKNKNIEITSPDINQSTNNYYIKDNKIIFPLSIINGINKTTIDKIVELKKDGYKDFTDFIVKTSSLNLNRKVITSLIKSGAFNKIDENPKMLINNMDSILNYKDLIKEAEGLELAKPYMIHYDDFTKEETIANEMEIYGFYLSNHPVVKYRGEFDILTKDISKYLNNYVNMTLLIDNIKEVTTKNNDIMAFISANDEYNDISLTLFPKTYKQYHNINKKDIISINGKVEKRMDKYQIIVNRIDVKKN